MYVLRRFDQVHSIARSNAVLAETYAPLAYSGRHTIRERHLEKIQVTCNVLCIAALRLPRPSAYTNKATSMYLSRRRHSLAGHLQYRGKGRGG